jgi:hypothetical protein
MKNGLSREQFNSFVASREAWKGTDNGLENLVRLERKDQSSKSPVSGSKQEDLDFYPDRVLVDLGAIPASLFDPQKIIKDCELVTQAARKHPDRLRQLIGVCRPDSSRSEMEEAFRIMQEIGVSEQAALRAGGGLLWLLALALVFASCEHCHAGHGGH